MALLRCGVVSQAFLKCSDPTGLAVFRRTFPAGLVQALLKFVLRSRFHIVFDINCNHFIRFLRFVGQATALIGQWWLAWGKG